MQDENDPERTISVLHESTDGCELVFDILASETAQEELSVEKPVVTELNSEVNNEDFKEVLDASYLDLLNTGNENDLLLLASKQRVIVSVDKLKELKGKRCTTLYSGNVCGLDVEYTASYDKGSVLVLRWSCKNEHNGMWKSSEVLKELNNNAIYTNDVLIPSAVVLSGNNYSKISLLFKALNVQVPSHTAFANTQKHYIAPTIFDFWKQMTDKTREVIGNRELCLLGDGRNDSPGHSAKYCCYVVMENLTKAVIDMKIVDKRETKGISTNMEVQAAKEMLLSLKDKYKLMEFVTDASSSVAKMVLELRGIGLHDIFEKCVSDY